MPVRFTCRLISDLTPAGNVRIRYGPVGEGTHRLFEFVGGTSMILPPDRELTPDECEAWEQSHIVPNGTFSGGAAPTRVALDAPLVEARRTYEDEIPPASVTAALRWVEGPPGQRTLGVNVTNGWNRPIPNLTVIVWHEAAENVVIKDIPANCIGGGIPLELMTPAKDPDLRPGESRAYALHADNLDGLRSLASALSPEDLWIELRTDGYAFERVRGNVVVAFLGPNES